MKREELEQKISEIKKKRNELIRQWNKLIEDNKEPDYILMHENMRLMSIQVDLEDKLLSYAVL